MSNQELKKLKDKGDTPEGRVDKSGNSLKFSRDMESDWTIKNTKPLFISTEACSFSP